MVAKGIIHVPKHCEPTISLCHVGGDEVYRRSQSHGRIEHRSIGGSQCRGDIVRIERKRQPYQSTSYPSNLFHRPLIDKASRIEDIIKRVCLDPPKSRTGLLLGSMFDQ